MRVSSNVRTAAEDITHPSKRTATQAGLDHPAVSQTSSASSTFQSPEEVEEVTEDDIKDELYFIMTTSVVGIQYYKGLPKVTCPSHSFIHQTSYRYGWAGRGSPFSERTSKPTRQVWLPVIKLLQIQTLIMLGTPSKLRTSLVFRSGISHARLHLD